MKVFDREYGWQEGQLGWNQFGLLSFLSGIVVYGGWN